MPKRKSEVVTFKADADLMEALRSVGNRSQFIRSAVAAALEGTCPLCMGRGTLTESQRRHWQELTGDHSIEECQDCHELRIVCRK